MPYSNHQMVGYNKTKSVLGTFSSNNDNISAAGYSEHMSKTNVKNSPVKNMMASSDMKQHIY